MKLPTIATPSFSRRAWIRYLRNQGATFREIANALGMPVLEVARLAVQPPRRQLETPNPVRLTR